MNSLIDELLTAKRCGLASSLLQVPAVRWPSSFPVLWFPNAAYQISAISPKLGGVTAQDSTAHIYPSSWYLKS